MKITRPCTEGPQQWGKGKFVKNAPPESIGSVDYGKQTKPDQFIDYDPRPLELRKTTKQERNM